MTGNPDARIAFIRPAALEMGARTSGCRASVAPSFFIPFSCVHLNVLPGAASVSQAE